MVAGPRDDEGDERRVGVRGDAGRRRAGALGERGARDGRERDVEARKGGDRVVEADESGCSRSSPETSDSVSTKPSRTRGGAVGKRRKTGCARSRAHAQIA